MDHRPLDGGEISPEAERVESHGGHGRGEEERLVGKEKGKGKRKKKEYTGWEIFF